jgi:peptidoglycan/xylan/chitin deacetylase (PgdA/CDA1 family)
MTPSRDEFNGTGSRAIGTPERIKVLMYHRVVRDEVVSAEARPYTINVDMLEGQVRTLEKLGYSAITFHDVALFRRGALNLPKKPVIISFDDGYEDTHRLAFPVLREYGMKAVVFVLGDRSIGSNSWDAQNNITSAPLMTERQILELHAAGFEIGSHSLTHRKLTGLTRDEAWDEISRSRILLEMTLNDTVRSFSYPYGLLNDQLRLLVQEAGYEFACGVYSGPSVFGVDFMDIRRIEPSEKDDALRFRLHIATPYQKMGAMRFRLKRFLERSDNGHSGGGRDEGKAL